MKKLWILCAATGFLYACGDNNVGNRTYDMNTPNDSANHPMYGNTGDTTPTSNNNAYNPDSNALTPNRDTSAVRQYGTQGKVGGAGQNAGQSGQTGTTGDQAGQSGQTQLGGNTGTGNRQ